MFNNRSFEFNYIFKSVIWTYRKNLELSWRPHIKSQFQGDIILFWLKTVAFFPSILLAYENIKLDANKK